MGSLFCLFHLAQARSKQEQMYKEPPSIDRGMDSGILFPPVLLNLKSANFGVSAEVLFPSENKLGGGE